MEKKTVAILFGGKSTEHEGSIESALHVINNIDKDTYNVHAIYINREGNFTTPKEFWNLLHGFFENKFITIIPSLEIPLETFIQSLKEFSIFPKNSDTGTVNFFENVIHKKYYAVFPIFHGLYGEDGSIQGMLKFLNTPCVGCGLSASVIGIDKDFTKIICKEKNINVTKHISLKNYELDNFMTNIEKFEIEINYPMFIKPARLGSSIGISRVTNRAELVEAVKSAFKYDDKIILEKGLTKPREFAIGIMGYGDELRISAIGEFQSFKEDFFDFEAKYGSNSLDGIIPAKIDKILENKLKTMAFNVYKSLELQGFSRIDCFYDGSDIYLNEVNTIPGLESHGTFTKTWAEIGVSRKEFLSLVIEKAKEHFST